MRKILGIGLFLVMVIFSLAACIPENKSIEDKDIKGLGSYEGLDAQTELQIIKYFCGDAYAGQESVDAWDFNFYYGVYNGYVVFNHVSADDSGWAIGGLFFSHPVTHEKIVAWKNGQSYDLKEIYEAGLISREELEEIHARVKENFAVRYPGEVFTGLGSYEGLDTETALKIIQSDLTWREITQEDIDTFCFEGYYGVYSGCVVYKLRRGWIFGLGNYLEEEMIDGLVFVDMYRRSSFLAWKDGKAYHLQQLYYDGLISRADLEAVYARHAELHPEFYADGE